MVKQRVTSAASEEDDGEQFCPLCLEVLDLTDRSFRPCQCGYQVCLWCFHHIKEKVNGLCPACRTPYEEGSFNALDPKLQAAAEAERRRKRDRDRIERATAKAAAAAAVAQTAQSASTVEATREPGAVDRATLQNVRVMQRNLVYVTGIPPSIAREDILRRKEHFGRFGRIVKIALNRKSGSANNYSAYVTFKRNADASECISQVSGSAHDGATIRATFGTTKYCSLFLRNAVCNNSNCLYLHELAKEGDCFRKEDLQHDVQLDEFEMDHAAPNRPISEPVVATAPPPQDTDRSPAPIRAPSDGSHI
ncbi:unnamed protein product (mitochondrion) [Plasmodiophora brassicae]|uniref:RING-type domain-containing protein n=1 Tax=Plasmodiophora brassicae TaxID=37360 RepID=A0A3P3XZW9_PLABS|nr:unnamed protein product [Plasmodiophora brassicae]